MDNIRLLIVDDDPDDRELFMDAVAEISPEIECLAAKNGLQALQVLNATDHPLPDLIFLDISMPLLNGNHCLAKIKDDSRLNHIPVIIYTTSKNIEESKLLKNMGALHFISKPADAGEIYYLVAMVLEEYFITSRNSLN